ncbi:MAG: xanthine dehydrogenase family protein subunit M [Bacteroidota bacterium]
MIPSTFSYHKAGSVSEALSLLAAHGDDAKILAGGHSLIPAMKLRLNNPEHLIDISFLKDLKSIRQEGNEIVVGALCTHGQLASDGLIAQHFAMMSQSAKLIGDVQVRNFGTLGGSIAHADPAADWPASLLTAEASVVIQGANGSRTLAARDFFQGFYETALGEQELITEIRLPIPAAGTTSAYAKFMQPASRFAIVGCAVMITQSGGTCTDVRVGFTGVSDMPFRDAGVENALKGQAPTAENIAAAAAHAAKGMDILSDHFASETYRQHLAAVYAKRAMMAAV